MSSSKQVLPPSRSKKPSPERTIQLLQKKLDVAERETVSLVNQLAGMGFSGDNSKVEAANRGQPMSRNPVQPFLPRSAETEILFQNYENLVARVCRNESQVQTLKLNLCSMQAAKDLNRQENSNLREQTAQLAEAHAAEVRKINQELARSRKEWKDAVDARNKAEEEGRRLRDALEVATSTKSDLAVEYEDTRMTKQKLVRRVSEMREELAREISLRSSLEDSHATLLQRIHEMEVIVESDRQEVQGMSENCIELRHEGARLLEEKKQEAAKRKILEEAVSKMKADLNSRDGKIAELLDQNKNFATALATSKKACSDLRTELENQAKLVIDTQALLGQMQSEREALQEEVQKATTQQNQVLSNQQGKLQAEHQSVVTQLQMRIQLLEKQKLDVELKLGQERQEKEALQATSSKAEEQLVAIRLRLSEQETKGQADVASLEHVLDQLKDDLQQATRDRDAALKSKESLLDEVNQAVDSMTEERRTVHEKITQAQVEITTLTRQKELVEQENAQLRERMTIVEQQQIAHQKVESTISDLLESKNRLAYEKGQLQNRVEQLQRELNSMEKVQTSANKQKKLNSELDAKLKENKRELTDSKQAVQRLENLLKKEQASAERKEQDFALAIQARDEAMKETEKLRSHLEASKHREKHKTTSLQKSLSDARTDHGKMAATLESVMSSHEQLQVAVEMLQTEMGQKDNELAVLRQERQSHKRTAEQTQREVTRLQEQLNAMETADSNQLASLNSELAKATDSQVKMAARLQEAVATISKFQVATEGLQSELDKREAQYQILSDTRQHEKEEAARASQEMQEKISTLRQQVKSFRDQTHKKLTKEVSDLRQAHAEANSRALELSKENKDLRSQVDDLEQTVSKLKTRVGSQKTQLDQYRTTQRTNKELETKLRRIEDQLTEMEGTKNEYAEKNRDQAQTIASFMEQMATLQQELENVSETQKQESQKSRDRLRKMEKEVERSGGLASENTKLRKQLKQLEDEKSTAEERLAEASNESLQISSHLQEAHEWFRSRYSSLQKALNEARRKQTELEQTVSDQHQELLHERVKAGEQTKRAQEMIRASRHALYQLANQAEIDHLETKTQMHSLARRVQAERDHATLADRKMQKLLNTSAELVEDLVGELDRSYHEARPL